jgi:uncharacterized membrane protein
MSTTLLLFILIFGILTGLRAFSPLAVLCWAAHFGWIPLGGTPFTFLGSIAAAIIVTAIALGELVNDKLPQTGSRTAPPALIGRIVVAGFCGAAVAFAAHHAVFTGVIIASFGALIGTFGGFHARRALVTGLRVPDLPVALIEDAITIGGAYLCISHLF